MKSCYCFLFSLLASGLFAQSPETSLPRFMTDQEKLQIATAAPGEVLPMGFANRPLLPVRAMAEWEELQALIISWNGYSAILTEIVRAARLECTVIICCNSQSTITSAKNTLTSKGVDITSNVQFMIAENNSLWVRDYGPNCVYANEVDSLYLIDWIYNRPRPLDDVLPGKVAQQLNLPLYSTTQAPEDLVNTGGNFMSDGLGTAFASRLILQENEPGNPYNVSPKTENDINAILQDYMGINRYIKMDKLPYDGIHHIDMHMKLLDEETLLVGQYPAKVADGPQIEANIQYVLANFSSSFGTPYQVLRIPMPPDAAGRYPDTDGDYRTYSNAVFVNKTVLVPFYTPQFDTTAQRIWQEALPGYKIVGINCNAIIPSLGAIHCITKEIGVADPLRIVHQPRQKIIQNTTEPTSYPFFATLQHRSGIASARLWFTTDTSAAWQSTAMSPYHPADTANVWSAAIPRQPAGSLVYYYIEATANSGKTGLRPMPAPKGWWKFQVVEDVSEVHDLPTAELLSIYPNPATAITCIPIYSNTGAAGFIRVYNTLGQRIETVFEGALPSGTSHYFLDASTYAAGAYFVELQIGGQRTLQKMMVR